jgi:hypothetical protein
VRLLVQHGRLQPGRPQRTSAATLDSSAARGRRSARRENLRFLIRPAPTSPPGKDSCKIPLPKNSQTDSKYALFSTLATTGRSELSSAYFNYLNANYTRQFF